MPLRGNTDGTERARTRRLLEACRDDPAGFQAAVLGRSLWHRQADVCRVVARSPVTVIPAGRAVGKSYLLAGLVLWWLYTRPGSLVITTAPTHKQVTTILWKEIRRALRPRRLGEAYLPRVRLGYDSLTTGHGSPQVLEVRRGTGWQALGFAAQSEEGFSGQHQGELLVVVDEGSGIRPEIWSAIHGLAATRLVIAGNPIRYDCHFRELHELAATSAGSAEVATVPISALESPHADCLHSPVGLASRSFLNRMRAIHGEESPWWRSNILALFPGRNESAFYPTQWLDACVRPEILADPAWLEAAGGAATMGVDVGGGVGADRSVVVVRDRKRILEVFASEWHGVLDGPEGARHRLEPVVLALARKWQVTPDRVIYDKAGVGRSFGSYLEAHARRERREWLERTPDLIIAAGEGPWPNGFEGAVGYFGAGKGGRLYINRRTACAFALKRRLDPGRAGHVPFYCGGIDHWPQLREELAELRAPTMEMEAGQVKQVIEDKDALMQRLKHSPDLMDALLMTFTYLE